MTQFVVRFTMLTLWHIGTGESIPGRSDARQITETGVPVILVDAIVGGGKPGDVVVLDAERLTGDVRPLSTHGISVAQAIVLGAAILTVLVLAVKGVAGGWAGFLEIGRQHEVLRTVYDPEIPVDIYELGLIYQVEVREGAEVYIQMTLTTPMCPVAGQIVDEARSAILGVDGVAEADVQLTFDPPWTPVRISPLIRSSLGL